MEIIKRHRSYKDGHIIGYTVRNNHIERFIKVKDMALISNQITNAKLMGNGEYRALTGYSIQTVVDTDKLKKNSLQTVPYTKVKNNPLNSLDFYGKEFIDVCRRIREYARKGLLEIDKRRHKGNDGNNLHLFKMIDACGITPEEFIRSYLAEIQPYSLSKYESSHYDERVKQGETWVCDIGYDISLLIKLEEKLRNKPLIISFHESNLKGSYRRQSIDLTAKPCAVFINRVTGSIDNTGTQFVSCTVQRGFIRTSIDVITLGVYQDIALVEYKRLEAKIDDTLDIIYAQLRNLYYDEINTDIPTIEIKKGQLNFLSFGFATINNISLLVDIYKYTKNIKERYILTGITANLIDEIPYQNKLVIKDALIEKFGIDYNNKLYLAVLDYLK